MDGQTRALTLNRNIAAALSVNGLQHEELITTNLSLLLQPCLEPQGGSA